MESPKDILGIRTPEQIGLQFPLAGLGSRAMAFLVDLAVRGVFILTVFVLVIIFVRVSGGFPAAEVFGYLSKKWIIALGILAYSIIELGYFLFFEATWNGQTPGKRFLRIRVMRADGFPVGWIESSIRNILRAVDIVGGVYPIGLLFMIMNRRAQRLGDLAAGTLVVIEKNIPVPQMTTESKDSTRQGDHQLEPYIVLLEPEEYHLVRSFLSRREAMETSHRIQLARELTQKLLEKWGLPELRDFSDESFLKQIIIGYEQRRRII